MLVGLFAGGVDGGDDLVVPNDAISISCPCFSSAVSAFFAPACCLASDLAPRYLASGRADPLASALLGQRISASLFLGRRCPARCATGSARGVAFRDPHDRPLAREGGQGIWLQVRGAASVSYTHLTLPTIA